MRQTPLRGRASGASPRASGECGARPMVTTGPLVGGRFRLPYLTRIKRGMIGNDDARIDFGWLRILPIEDRLGCMHEHAARGVLGVYSRRQPSSGSSQHADAKSPSTPNAPAGMSRPPCSSLASIRRCARPLDCAPLLTVD